MHRMVYKLRRSQQGPAPPSATRVINHKKEPTIVDDDASIQAATSAIGTMSLDARPPEEQPTWPVSPITITMSDSSSLCSESPSSSTSCQSPSIEQQIYMSTTLAAAMIPPGSPPRVRNTHMMSKYKLLGALGTGSTGRVSRGQNVRDGTFAALKIIYKHRASDATRLQVEAEVKALQILDHPHIIKLLEVAHQAMYSKSNGQEVASTVLVLELAEQGDLFDRLSKIGPFPEILARTFFKQLLSAIQYCHSEGICHRDIKPENLLLDEHFQLKLADFGLCDIENDHSERKLRTCGTRAYMAPEVLNCEAHDGAKADSWSMGVVLFSFLTGCFPFEYAGQGDWWYETICKNGHARFWKYHLAYSNPISSEAQALLTAIFQSDPKKRLSNDQMMSHKWTQGPCLSDEDLFAAMSNGNLPSTPKRRNKA